MKLGPYKHLKAVRKNIHISEDEINRILKKEQYRNSLQIDFDDRPAGMGDLAIIDMQGTVDGKPLSGKRTENFPVDLGSHRFAKGFEESIVGHKVGDELNLRLTFSKNYRDAALSGKTAIFHVVIRRLATRQLQPLDDDFAKDFSDYDSLEEWKTALREELLQNRREEAEEELEETLLQEIIDGSEIPVDPSLADAVFEEMYEEFLYEIRSSHMELPDYCKRTGRTEEEVRQLQHDQALKSIQAQLVLQEIAQIEHLTVTEEELNDQLYSLAAEEDFEEYCSPEETSDITTAFRNSLDEEELEAIRDDILMDKAMQLILDTADYEETK